MRTVTYALPTFWACPLFYDDTSALDATDQTHFDAFCKAMSDRYCSWNCVDIDSDNTEFMRFHDAAPYGVLACDATTFMFHVSEED